MRNTGARGEALEYRKVPRGRGGAKVEEGGEDRGEIKRNGKTVLGADPPRSFLIKYNCGGRGLGSMGSRCDSISFHEKISRTRFPPPGFHVFRDIYPLSNERFTFERDLGNFFNRRSFHLFLLLLRFRWVWMSVDIISNDCQLFLLF